MVAERARHHEDPGGVDRHAHDPVLDRIGPILHGTKYGVVDQHVQPASVVEDAVAHRVDRLSIGLIELKGDDLEPAVAERLGLLLQLLDGAAGHVGLGAGLGQGLGDLPAESTGPARHQRVFPSRLNVSSTGMDQLAFTALASALTSASWRILGHRVS